MTDHDVSDLDMFKPGLISFIQKLCNDNLRYCSKITIEGILGITQDLKQMVIINFSESENITQSVEKSTMNKKEMLCENVHETVENQLLDLHCMQVPETNDQENETHIEDKKIDISDNELHNQVTKDLNQGQQRKVSETASDTKSTDKSPKSAVKEKPEVTPRRTKRKRKSAIIGNEFVYELKDDRSSKKLKKSVDKQEIGKILLSVILVSVSVITWVVVTMVPESLSGTGLITECDRILFCIDYRVTNQIYLSVTRNTSSAYK